MSMTNNQKGLFLPHTTHDQHDGQGAVTEGPWHLCPHSPLQAKESRVKHTLALQSICSQVAHITSTHISWSKASHMSMINRK